MEIYYEILFGIGTIACNIMLISMIVYIYKILAVRRTKMVFYGDSLNDPNAAWYGISVVKRLIDTSDVEITNRSKAGAIAAEPLFAAYSRWNWLILPDVPSSHNKAVIMLGANDLAWDTTTAFNKIYRGILSHIIGASINIGSWLRRPGLDYTNMVNIMHQYSSNLQYDLATLRPAEQFSFQVTCDKRYIIIGIYPYDGSAGVMEVYINDDLYYLQDVAFQQGGYYSYLVVIDSGISSNKTVKITGKATNNTSYIHFTTVNSVDSFPIPVDVVSHCILSNSNTGCKNNVNYRAAVEAAVVRAKRYGIKARLIDVPSDPSFTRDSVHGDRVTANLITKEILAS